MITHLIFFLLVLSIRPAEVSQLNLHGGNPSIAYVNGQYTLDLPERMKSALKKFNPAFEAWRTEDYTSAVIEDVKEDGNPNRAPFALIVNVNKDNIPDVIIDGHDKKNSLLICLISDKDDFKVISIEENKYYIPSEIISFNDGKKETGLNYFLWPSEPETLSDSPVSFIFTLGFTQQTNADGEFLNDGGIIDYYFENGSFRSENETP